MCVLRMDFWNCIVLLIFINGAVSQSWWSSSTPSGGVCEISFNSTVLNSLDEVSPETFIIDSIEVMSYSRGQLNDWVFRTCRSFEMIVSRLNQSCSEKEIKQTDTAEYATFKKSLALAAGHEYFCANAGANLKDLILNNGPQCVQDTIRYWNECPSTPSNSRRPTNVVFTTYTFSSDACSFLVTTERCYMNAFNQSSLCVGNAPRHFQTYVGILLETIGCADRNVFGRAPPIGFRDLPNFNVRQHPSLDNHDPNAYNRNQQTNIDRIGFNSQDFGLNRNNFNNGNGQFPPNNQFSRDVTLRPQNGFDNYFSGSQGQPSDINNQFGFNSPNPQDQNHFNPGFSNDRNQNHPVTPRVYNNSNYFNPNIDSNSRNFGNQNGFQQNPNSNWNRPDMANNPYGEDGRNSWRNEASQNPNAGSYDPNYLNSRPGSSFNEARERNGYNNSVEEVKITLSAFFLTIGSILILQ